jgi:hypothetical protein
MQRRSNLSQRLGGLAAWLAVHRPIDAQPRCSPKDQPRRFGENRLGDAEVGSYRQDELCSRHEQLQLPPAKCNVLNSELEVDRPTTAPRHAYTSTIPPEADQRM